jgi:DNA primase
VYELPVDMHTVVVTEDILSAIKVNSVGYSTLSILGTAVSPAIASRIARYKDIIIWTDSDKAGDAAYVKLRKKLALYPVKVRRIVTDNDPKLIHKKTIRKLMETI